MPIAEAQLETWSHQPAPGPSRATYASVKAVLEDPAAPYPRPDVFLQGSYGNDTNVYRESDVDVVACTSEIFYHDARTLPSAQFQAFERAYPGAGAYTYRQYKADVAAWLIARFGPGVRAGDKAIFIPGTGGRRDCDVLPAVSYRYYYSFDTAANQNYASGICFFLPDGTQIVNFPKQHSANATTKHQATQGWFKPTVRIFKNLRNALVSDGRLGEGVAPSYFIEGLVYNAPNALFGGTYQATVGRILAHLVNADRSVFVCVNGIHALIGTGPVQWRPQACDAFLAAVGQRWLE